MAPLLRIEYFDQLNFDYLINVIEKTTTKNWLRRPRVLSPPLGGEREHPHRWLDSLERRNDNAWGKKKNESERATMTSPPVSINRPILRERERERENKTLN